MDEAKSLVPFKNTLRITLIQQSLMDGVDFEGLEDDDGNLSTPAQDQENGWSRFVVTKVDDGSEFYVIWDYPSKSISEFNEG